MRTRWAIAAAASAALQAPSVAHASAMSGLCVIVAGMFVGVPAAVLLVVSIVVSIAARARPTPAGWHRPYAATMSVVAPLLGLSFPLSVLALGGHSKSDPVVLAFFFDLPVIVLAVVALVLARRAGAPR